MGGFPFSGSHFGVSIRGHCFGGSASEVPFLGGLHLGSPFWGQTQTHPNTPLPLLTAPPNRPSHQKTPKWGSGLQHYIQHAPIWGAAPQYLRGWDPNTWGDGPQKPEVNGERGTWDAGEASIWGDGTLKFGVMDPKTWGGWDPKVWRDGPQKPEVNGGWEPYIWGEGTPECQGMGSPNLGC